MPRFAYPGLPMPSKLKPCQSSAHTLPPSSPPSPCPGASPTQRSFCNLHTQGRGSDQGQHGLSKPQAGAVPLPGLNLEALQRQKKRSQSLTRYALSDGEPEDDESSQQEYAPPITMPSYATLGRKPGHGQSDSSTSQRYISRSQSFGTRTRRKGPPPQPPKRMSSVSGSQASQIGGTAAVSEQVEAGRMETESAGSVRSITSRLQGYKPGDSLSPRTHTHKPVPALGLGGLKRMGSERRDKDGWIDRRLEEEGKGRQSGSQVESSMSSISSENIPFAEEGNLTIKQRPRIGSGCQAEPNTQPQASPEDPKMQPVKSLEVPEFNLKESDTVKRRRQPRDHETHTLEEIFTASEDNRHAESHMHGRSNGFHTHTNGDTQPEEEAEVTTEGGLLRERPTGKEHKPASPPLKPVLTTKPASPPLKPVLTTKPASPPLKPVLTTKPASPPLKPVLTTKPASPPLKPALTTKPASPPLKPVLTTKPASPPLKPALTTKPASPPLKPVLTTKPASTPLKCALNTKSVSQQSHTTISKPVSQQSYTTTSKPVSQQSHTTTSKPVSQQSHTISSKPVSQQKITTMYKSGSTHNQAYATTKIQGPHRPYTTPSIPASLQRPHTTPSIPASPQKTTAIEFLVGEAVNLQIPPAVSGSGPSQLSSYKPPAPVPLNVPAPSAQGQAAHPLCYSTSWCPGQVGQAGKPQAAEACSEGLVQRRLEKTSTSLEEALRVVERRLAENNCTHSDSSTVEAAGNILDDIGNMFDDLAEQLDAMLD
uniref:Caskin C-terminal domain-containing protein n=2 Tax=Esox lucius TaxID=8010 RepID=A0AAY5JWE2_ESOLU